MIQGSRREIICFGKSQFLRGDALICIFDKPFLKKVIIRRRIPKAFTVFRDYTKGMDIFPAYQQAVQIIH